MGLQNFSSYNDLITGGVYAIPNYVTGTWAETGRQPTTETIGNLSWTTYQYRYEVFSTPNTYEQIAYVRENSITGTITGYSLYTNDLNISNNVVSVGNTVGVTGTVSTTPPTGTTAVSGTVSVGNTVAVSGTVTATPTGVQEVSGSSSYNSGIVYYKKSFTRMMDWKYGLQNICACWSRCNEGDYIDVFVDAPLFDQYYQITGWVQVAQFAEYVTIFGTNSAGTWYPPDTSPNMSWVPQYCRIRFDFYKLKDDNTWLDSEPGPFVEVDFIGQRER